LSTCASFAGGVRGFPGLGSRENLRDIFSRGLHGRHAGARVAQDQCLGILTLLSVARSLFSQMAIAALAVVPLWKVIAGSRRQTAAGPARVRFSFAGSGSNPSDPNCASKLDRVAARVVLM